MYVMAPVAWPIAKLLDRLLGEDHGTTYKKAGLKTLVTLHKTLGEAGEQLNSDEVTIISAVLDLKEKSVGTIMTPMDDVFTMSADTILDEQTMDLILSQGYSRIPIHAPETPRNFIGMLLVKMLITYDPEDCKPVSHFSLATLPETRPETSCLDIVNFFQEGKSHMVLVSEFPGEDRGALGVVTLEDVIEELIGEYVPETTRALQAQANFICREIIDESDVFVDVHKAIRRMAPAPYSRVPKGRFVEEPPVIPAQGPLVDIGGDSPATTGHSMDRRRSSVEAPLARYQLRRSLGDKERNSTDGYITRLGSTDDIREHLKHLGPSNLASRPRQTRYQNVKIKRGSISPSRSGQTDVDSGTDSHTRRQPTSFPTTSDTTLTSSGLNPRDGAHALLMSSTGRSSSESPAKNGPPVSIPEQVNEEQESAPQSAHSRHTGSGGSQDGDQTYSQSYIHRGPARSGSITEHIVDVNGIRKVVLHTTSSNSSSDAEATRSKFPVRQGSEVIDLNETDGDHSEQSKKKRRRRKHKKSRETNGGEATPLLP
jgi:metal transporter CNNM